MKISLAEFVGEVGQAKAADAIGVHQTAISKAIRVGRQIFYQQASYWRGEGGRIPRFSS
ncbi:Cro/CI family transcriptional regulator [Enterobacter hormaechei]